MSDPGSLGSAEFAGLPLAREEASLQHASSRATGKPDARHADETPRPGETPIAVAIVDKSPIVQTGLKSVIAKDARFAIAFVATDGERLMNALERLRCDVLVTGWSMPFMDGRGVLEALRERPGAPPIIVYTGSPDPDVPAIVMRLGGAAFVSKTEPPEKLLEAVAAVAGGQMVFPIGARRTLDNPLSTLSPREQQMLEALSSGRTNAELARAFNLSPNTVKFHLRNLFDKLSVRNRAQAVHLLATTRRS
ncbi:response regulator transcription factor [Arboricoccus pini]|uniref:response regulator transcription factor n=1 Tax=Arboricoccus pini TaxID=1963835 RepID=UPI001FAE9606|nr:response regulator transcription factor [Arboricoccus pini]